jgi:hypothetical protein
MEQLQSIYMTNGLIIYSMAQYLRISLYIRKLLLKYDFATDPFGIFLYILGNFYFLFDQCKCLLSMHAIFT